MPLRRRRRKRSSIISHGESSIPKKIDPLDKAVRLVQLNKKLEKAIAERNENEAYFRELDSQYSEKRAEYLKKAKESEAEAIHLEAEIQKLKELPEKEFGDD